VCEQRHRHWIGIELESCAPIIERLKNGDVSNHRNEDAIELRINATIPHLSAAESRAKH
jgi:hypothetical protein